MDDAAILSAQMSAVGFPGCGCQIDQHFSSRGCGAPESLRLIGRRAAAECAHVERRQLGVCHYQMNEVRRSVKLFGDDLRERRSNVLTHLGLAGVYSDLAVFADV